MHYEPSYCPYLHGCIKWMLPLLMMLSFQPRARAQAGFVDVSDEVNVYSDHTGGYWGTGLSTVDFNGDGYDDITLAHHAGDLRFYIGNGTGFEEITIDLPDYPFEAKAPIWADIDNDGDQDLFITYRLAANKLYLNNGNLEFVDISQTSGINFQSKKLKNRRISGSRRFQTFIIDHTRSGTSNSMNLNIKRTFSSDNINFFNIFNHHFFIILKLLVLSGSLLCFIVRSSFKGRGIQSDNPPVDTN